MRRGRLAWLFLGLGVLGILWPVVAGAVSCGDCCAGRTSACGQPPTSGFSLCCYKERLRALREKADAGEVTAAGSWEVERLFLDLSVQIPVWEDVGRGELASRWNLLAQLRYAF
jgi:hypothetical protein